MVEKAIEAERMVEIQHSGSETSRPEIRQNVIWTKGQLDYIRKARLGKQGRVNRPDDK